MGGGRGFKYPQPRRVCCAVLRSAALLRAEHDDVGLEGAMRLRQTGRRQPTTYTACFMAASVTRDRKETRSGRTAQRSTAQHSQPQSHHFESGNNVSPAFFAHCSQLGGVLCYFVLLRDTSS